MHKCALARGWRQNQAALKPFGEQLRTLEMHSMLCLKSLSSAIALLQELEDKEEKAANLHERVLLLEARDRNRASVEAIYAKMVALGIMDQVRLLHILRLMSWSLVSPKSFL